MRIQNHSFPVRARVLETVSLFFIGFTFATLIHGILKTQNLILTHHFLLGFRMNAHVLYQ